LYCFPAGCSPRVGLLFGRSVTSLPLLGCAFGQKGARCDSREATEARKVEFGFLVGRCAPLGRLDRAANSRRGPAEAERSMMDLPQLLRPLSLTGGFGTGGLVEEPSHLLFGVFWPRNSSRYQLIAPAPFSDWLHARAVPAGELFFARNDSRDPLQRECSAVAHVNARQVRRGER
jgi:hypothetical protein